MKKFVVIFVTLTLLGLSKSEVKKDKEVAREGGWGNSQQYHYSSYPQHGGWGHSGLSLDLSTGITVIVAILVIFGLLALIYSFTNKGGQSSGWGWDSSRSHTKSIDLAATAEKVLMGVEKMYDVYRKSQ